MSVCCVPGSLPTEEGKQRNEVASGPGGKELQPLSPYVSAVITAEVVKIQMKHLRSSFTRHLAHELSMGKRTKLEWAYRTDSSLIPTYCSQFLLLV